MMRRMTALTTVAALSAGLTVAASTANADTGSTTSRLPLTCRSVPGALVGPRDSYVPPIDVTVSSPENVTVGEEFSVNVHMDIPDGPGGGSNGPATLREVSRIKMDLALPDGVDFLGAEISRDTPGSNLHGFTVLRVDEAGVPDPSGSILRLVGADNATIGSGPNSRTDRTGGVSTPAVDGAARLGFPDFTLKLRADTGGVKRFGVRTGGDAARYGDGSSFLTFLPRLTVGFLTVWAPTSCSPRPGPTAELVPAAGNLRAVTVTDSPAAETVLSVDVPGTVTAGVPARFSAHLDPDDANGTVSFFVDEPGGAVSDVRTTRGGAVSDLTFTRVGTTPLRVIFNPDDPENATGAATSTEVTVSPRVTDLGLSLPWGARAGDRVTATAEVPTGATGEIEFTVAGRTVTAPVLDGRASAVFVFDEIDAGTATAGARYIPDADSVYAPAETSRRFTVFVLGHPTEPTTATPTLSTEPEPTTSTPPHTSGPATSPTPEPEPTSPSTGTTPSTTTPTDTAVPDTTTRTPEPDTAAGSTPFLRTLLDIIRRILGPLLSLFPFLRAG